MACAEPRRGASGARQASLSAGVGAAGLLTYLFFALASHNLDATAYGEIVVLWSAVFVTISVAPPAGRAAALAHASPSTARAASRSARAADGRADPGAGRARLRGRGARLARPAPGRPALRARTTLYWIYVGAVTRLRAPASSPAAISPASGRFSAARRPAGLANRSRGRRSRSRSRSASPTGSDAVALGDRRRAAVLASLVVPLAFGRRAARAAPPPASAPPRRVDRARARRRHSPAPCC